MLFSKFYHFSAITLQTNYFVKEALCFLYSQFCTSNNLSKDNNQSCNPIPAEGYYLFEGILWEMQRFVYFFFLTDDFKADIQNLWR